MVATMKPLVILNCAATVDAATTIPSLAPMAAAKIPLLLPPLTVASTNANCYCRH